MTSLHLREVYDRQSVMNHTSPNPCRSTSQGRPRRCTSGATCQTGCSIPLPTIGLQGELDEGPVAPNARFLPHRKLGQISAHVGAPLVAVLMAEEKNGPWVYPECFPPVGGDASLIEFVRRRQWRAGSYSTGPRWVTEQLWSGYRGQAYFRNHGERGICHTVEGQLWQERWDLPSATPRLS